MYCLLPLSNRNGIFLLRPNDAQMVVSALLTAPSTTTKQPARAAGKQRISGIRKRQHSSTTTIISKLASSVLGENDLDNNNSSWRSNMPRDEYASPLLWETRGDWVAFLKQFEFDRSDSEGERSTDENVVEMGDPLWEQVKLEALTQLSMEPEAGPQLYQSILSQGSLVEAIVSIIART
jgi:hypothetical protein